MNDSSPHPSPRTWDERTGTWGFLGIVTRGTLAGFVTGAVAAAAFTLAVSLASPSGPADSVTRWLIKTAFAVILAGVMGSWSGAKVGFILSLLLAICRRRYGLILVLAPFFGLVAGISWGHLAPGNPFPSFRPVALAPIQCNQLLQLTIQLAAALTTSWTLTAHPRRQAATPPRHDRQFDVCDWP